MAKHTGFYANIRLTLCMSSMSNFHEQEILH